MKWPWQKKEQSKPVEKIGRRLRIPMERRRDYLMLWDQFVRAHEENEYLYLAEHDLWIFIEEVLPETKAGKWRHSDKEDPFEIIEIIKD